MVRENFSKKRSSVLLPVVALGLSFALGGCGGGAADIGSSLPTNGISVNESNTGGSNTSGTTPVTVIPSEGVDIFIPDDDSSQPVTRNVKVSWSAPTERENGQPLAMSELAGYRIYLATDAEPDAAVIEVSDPYVFDYTIENLKPGTYRFSVTVIDTEGRESSRTSELSSSV